ncbi:MAG: hypothetical protein WC485_04560 [Opitutaceae bacterium]
MKALIVFALLAVTGVAAPSEEELAMLRQVPDQNHYSPREMVLSANAFLALGPAKCEAALEDLCRWSDVQKEKNWYQTNGRLLLLMRTLYVSDPVDPIPVPAMGQPVFPVTESDWQEWLYFPLEFSGGVPLLLPSGYILAGSPVLAGKYLGYCRSKGWLRRSALHVPTDEDLSRAIRLLVDSRRWRASRWRVTDVGDAANSKASEEERARAFLYEQSGLKPPEKAANQPAEPTRASAPR